MKVVQIVGEREVVIAERPDPKPAEDFVVVKIHVAPLCTEYKAFKGGGQHLSMGHEAAGEVVAVDRSCRVAVGDRVVVMPQHPCGHCPLCLAGDYIHCQQCKDPLGTTGSEAGTGTLAQYVIKED